MIAKSQGIVLSTLPFQEHSIIARLYTRDFGYGAFIVRGVRRARARGQLAYFQPFTILDVVVYVKASRSIQNLTEYKALHYEKQPDVRKQTVMLFLSEVLQQLLRQEEESNPAMYDYLCGAIQIFHDRDWIQNFHVQCLVQLTPFLGISIGSVEILLTELQNHDMSPSLRTFFEESIFQPIGAMNVVGTGTIRSEAIGWLLDYFALHIPGFGPIQSTEVLQRIFY